MTLFIESTPLVSFDSPHVRGNRVLDLIELDDGSFVTCSSDNTVKRWAISNNNGVKSLQLVGTYDGTGDYLLCVMEKDNDVLITGHQWTLTQWNKQTCEQINVIETLFGVRSLVRTKNKLKVACGLINGSVEMRRLNHDLSLISSFPLHKKEVSSISELQDGSFISASSDNMIKRWNDKGIILHTFKGHKHFISRVIQLQSDVIVSTSDDWTIKMWQLSTGELLRTIKLWFAAKYMEKLSEGKFVTISSGEYYNNMRVWDDKGDCIDSMRSNEFSVLTRLSNGSLVVGKDDRLEIRRLK